MDDLSAAARAIVDAETVVALTGAGISTASGIPDFRGPGGLWERFDPGDFHIGRLNRDPAAFWDRWLALHDEVFADGDPSPNPAHEALATLEAAGHLDAVMTQNVDGLHQAAGSERVVELHGTHDRVVCRDCSRRSGIEQAIARARNGERPPRCETCSGVLKPDSVLFGERLPEHALLQSHAHAEQSDVFLVGGSSLTVEPAASLPAQAVDTGASLLVFNAEPTPHDNRAAFVARDDLEVVLPELVETVRTAAAGG